MVYSIKHPVTIVTFSDDDEVIFYGEAYFYTSVDLLICLCIHLFSYFFMILMTKHLFPDQGLDECQTLWEKVRQCRANYCCHLFYQRLSAIHSNIHFGDDMGYLIISDTFIMMMIRVIRLYARARADDCRRHLFISDTFKYSLR